MSAPGRPERDARGTQPEAGPASVSRRAAPADRMRRWLHARREPLLLALAALLLAGTFARPQARLPLPQVDAVVVFDVTQSMNVADAGASGTVSRLAHAQAEFERMLADLPCGSRIGWGVFTDHRSFLLIEPVEVCEHLRELVAGLRRIGGGMAWAGNSEVAKGIDSGMRMVDALAGTPLLVFVTDGHEAPPLSPAYRPSFKLDRGKVQGLLLGVGGDVPQPIPKRDPSGRDFGVWGANEVIQVDPRTLGRAGNREAMVDTQPTAPAPPWLGATPGLEHLSSLREGYLQRLASETGLRYARLGGAQDVLATLTAAPLARRVEAPADLRPVLAGLALLALCAPSLWWRRRAVSGP